MKHKLTLVLLSFFLGVQCMVAQQMKVTGVVINEDDGEPVIGASIVVKGTTIGTITDLDGKFELETQKDAKLIISYVGLRTQETTAQQNMRIVLSSDSQAIDEVVVVAYGTAKKSSFTGSASTVGAALMDKRPLSNALSALEGNTSGVQMTSSIGQPGEAAKVTIRGFGSVNADNAPLYVVDGAIFSGDISSISPSDIESMTILKDAASTSLYGSSAGNGVVLITTKKGSSSSGAGVTLSISQGWSSRAYNDYAKVGVYDYYPLQWQMLRNANMSLGQSATDAAANASKDIINKLKYNPFVGIANDAIVGTDGLLNPSASALKWGEDLDWEDAAYRTGHRQEYNVSYNTKTEKSDTYASIGYLNDKGYMIKTDFERYNARLNYNIYPVKWFKSGLNLGLSRTNSNYSTSTSSNSAGYGNLSRFIRSMAPIYPVHKHDIETGAYLDKEGNVVTDPALYTYDYEGARISSNGRDGIAEALWNDRLMSTTNSSARTYVTITPIEGLNLTVNYAFDNKDERRRVYENPEVGDGTAGPGRLNIRNRNFLTQTFNQLINYTKTFGKHNIEALLGHENYSYRLQYNYGMKTNEIVSGTYEYSNFVSISSMDSYTREYKKEGYFARLNYDFDDKYYVTASYRRDGSSRFSKDNRWGNFWSVGAGWLLSKEKFLENQSWIDMLKFKISYGLQGNDNLMFQGGLYRNYYPYQDQYTLANSNGDFSTSLYYKGNKEITWETSHSFNTGFDFAFWGGKLGGSVEYFSRKTTDMLYFKPVAASMGYSRFPENVGSMVNRGVELDLYSNIIENKNFSWNVNFNLTHFKNKVLELSPELNGQLIDGARIYREDESMYQLYLPKYVGVDSETGESLWALVTPDENGNTVTKSYSVASENRFASGDILPKVYGGFGTSVTAYGFDLSVSFAYQLGGRILDYTYQGLMDVAATGSALHKDMLKAWTPENKNTDVPRMNINDQYTNRLTDRFLTSSDYLSLQNITLGYTLPKSLTRKMQIDGVRVFFVADNVALLTARKGLDPRQGYVAADNVYSPIRTISGGISLNF